MENKKVTIVLIAGLFLLIFAARGSYDYDLLTGKSIADNQNVRNLDKYNIHTTILEAGGNYFLLDHELIGMSYEEIVDAFSESNKGQILAILDNPYGSFIGNDQGYRRIFIPYGSAWYLRIPYYQKRDLYTGKVLSDSILVVNSLGKTFRG